MPLEAHELHAFADAINAAEGAGVPQQHVEWHLRYLQRLAEEMRYRMLITEEAQLLAEASEQLKPPR